MKNQGIYKFGWFLCLFILFSFASCNDDDDSSEEEASTAELIIGTWTSTDIEIRAFVGTQTLVEYLVDVEGLSQAEAEAQFDLFVAALEPELTGSLTINSDGTYESDFEGGSDVGTWSLNDDETVLTLVEGADLIIITINNISSDTWDATLGDTFLVDVDDDPGTPDVSVMVEADVILVK